MDLNLTAFTAAFILFMGAALVLSKRRPNPTYDERQLLERGRAYETGFLVSAVLALVSAIVIMWEPSLQRYAVALLMAVVFSGGTVVVARCIWTDAYVSTTTNVKSYFLITGLAAALNIALPILHGPWGSLDEFLASAQFINLICGLEFTVAFVTFLAKAAAEKREEA